MNTNAEILEKFLQKMLNKGYDFVIASTAGNVNNDSFVEDHRQVYGYLERKMALNLKDMSKRSIIIFLMRSQRQK